MPWLLSTYIERTDRYIFILSADTEMVIRKSLPLLTCRYNLNLLTMALALKLPTKQHGSRLPSQGNPRNIFGRQIVTLTGFTPIN